MKNWPAILLIAVCFPIQILWGQGETNNWYFGNGAGIQFNDDGSVTAVTNGKISTFEGCATMSDATGNLLFYSDGITVYNRNHEIMENGNGLFGDPSSTQSALIAPLPENPNQYYIFTVDTSTFEEDPDNGLNYSIVDISLDGGNGAVIQKNRQLLKDCSEKVTAVIKNCFDKSTWLVTLASADGIQGTFDTYYAYELNSSGLQTTPVKSTFNGLNISDPRGYLKFSPDGKKMASANAMFGLYVYDFNSDTGKFSNQERITIRGSNGIPYGVEFSPNGQFLYVHSSNIGQESGRHSSSLLQYDVLSSDISSSAVVIDSRNIYRGALQLANNGKIYRTISQDYATGTSYLGVISNPNSKGLAANYEHNSVNLNGKLSGQGLPPFIQSFFNRTGLIKNADGTTSNSFSVCEGESFILEAENIAGATYSWEKNGTSFPNTNNYFLEIPVADSSSSGRYSLTIQKADLAECPIIGESTIYVDALPNVGNLVLEQCDVDANNPSDGITKVNLRQIEDNVDYSYFYYETPQDMANDTQIANPREYLNTTPFNQTIVYNVVNNLGCGSSGEIQLLVRPIILNSNSQNTFYTCDINPENSVIDGMFDLIEIGRKNYPNNEVSFYSTLEDVTLEQNPLPDSYISEATTIYGRLENANQCQDVIEISLVVYPTPSFSFEETYTVCTDNPTLVINAPDGYDSYRYSKIENGTGQVISLDKQAKVLEAGSYILEAGITYSNNNETVICYNSQSFEVLPSNIATIDHISIQDISENNIVEVNALGDGDYEFSIDGIIYQTSNVFENVPPGIMTVFVKDKNGCGILEELISVVGYHKFFTPNNDGSNDTWQLIGVNEQFQENSRVSIFDRYGKLVAEIRPNSAGWDGTHNATSLPASDYWFRAFLSDGREFKGHFALKR